jgi:16S rRNA (guanine527-N7)-methyltransferase
MTTDPRDFSSGPYPDALTSSALTGLLSVTDPQTLQSLAAGIGAEVSLDCAKRLLDYLDAMLAENEHVNLTAVCEHEAAVLFHALDSLALACGGLERAPVRALDLGTGNGFPGVAIACVFPWSKVVLMDRTLKKLKAIERALVSAGFGMAQFETIQMDAHEAPARGFKSSFDLITARAVAPPEELAPLAKPLLTRGGRLLCWLSEEAVVQNQLKGGLKRVHTFEYSLPEPADRRRRLVHYRRR